MFTEDVIKDTDWVVIQGSTYDPKKLGPAVPDKIIELAWKLGKKRLLTMPTDVKFGAQEAERFQFLIPSSDMISANAAELAAVLKQDPPRSLFSKWSETPGKDDAEKAANKLQYIFNHCSEVTRPQEAYITNGGEGIYVIVKGMQKPIFVPVAPLEKKVQDIGAGDTFLGAVFAARDMGVPPREAAIIGSHVAAAKLGYNAARHPYPKGEILEREKKHADLAAVVHHNHVFSAEMHGREPQPVKPRDHSFVDVALLRSGNNGSRMIQ
jgi:sugar/nucleoside kinase (ribokinase family)